MVVRSVDSASAELHRTCSLMALPDMRYLIKRLHGSFVRHRAFLILPVWSKCLKIPGHLLMRP